VVGRRAVRAGGCQGVEVSVRQVGAGRTGQELWWARGSWWHGSESSEREGQGCATFFWIRQSLPSATPNADGSCLNFRRPHPG
jgi:hypothetical protein